MIIPPEQSGFRLQHNSASALLTVVDDIIQATDIMTNLQH